MIRSLVAALVFTLLVSMAAGAEGLTIWLTGDIGIATGTGHDGSAVTLSGHVLVTGTALGSVLTYNGSILLTPTARGPASSPAPLGRLERND